MGAWPYIGNGASAFAPSEIRALRQNQSSYTAHTETQSTKEEQGETEEVIDLTLWSHAWASLPFCATCAMDCILAYEVTNHTTRRSHSMCLRRPVARVSSTLGSGRAFIKFAYIRVPRVWATSYPLENLTPGPGATTPLFPHPHTRVGHPRFPPSAVL